MLCHAKSNHLTPADYEQQYEENLTYVQEIVVLPILGVRQQCWPVLPMRRQHNNTRRGHAKWEYKIIDSQRDKGEGIWGEVRSTTALEAYLNYLGRQGWEIIDMDVLKQQAHINFVGVAR